LTEPKKKAKRRAAAKKIAASDASPTRSSFISAA